MYFSFIFYWKFSSLWDLFSYVFEIDFHYVSMADLELTIKSGTSCPQTYKDSPASVSKELGFQEDATMHGQKFQSFDILIF